MGRPLWIRLLVLAAVMPSLPAPAWGQAEFAWQIHGGGVSPLSSYVHSGIRVDTSAAVATGESGYVASLVDQYNALGFFAGTALLFYPYELRYDFMYLGWDRALTACTGSSGAIVLPSGEVDDSTVAYTCTDERTERDISGEGLDPIVLHVISVGSRFTLFTVGRLLETYLVISAGIGLSTYTDLKPDAGLAVGPHLSGGLGIDLDLSETFVIVAESRYGLLLMTPPTRLQDASNRVVARGGSSIEALVDAFHHVDFNLGLRVNFR